MLSVDRGQEKYGSSVKEDFLEVAAEWSVDGSQRNVLIKQHIPAGE